jgi:cytoskeletal protein RodZ
MNIRTDIFIALITAVALVLAPAVFAGKVYKWVDQNGNVHYGADRPSNSAQELNIKVKPSSRPSPAKSAQSEDGQQSEREQAEETVKVNNEKELAEVEKKNAEIRKKNCSVAKKRLGAIKAGGRLYEVNEQGERSYWDDSTRQAKMAEAQAQVSEWCK